MNPGRILSTSAGILLGLGVLFWLRDETSDRPGPPAAAAVPAAAAPRPAAAAQPAPAPVGGELAEALPPALEPPAAAEPAAAPAAAANADSLSYRDLRGDARLAYDRYYRESPGSQGREEALFELAMADQPAVLPFLLDEYAKVEPAERELVLGAVIQHGSRAAAPALRKFAEKAASLDEEVALTEAAEFLEMMSLTEYIEKRPDLNPGAKSDEPVDDGSDDSEDDDSDEGR